MSIGSVPGPPPFGNLKHRGRAELVSVDSADSIHQVGWWEVDGFSTHRNPFSLPPRVCRPLGVTPPALGATSAVKPGPERDECPPPATPRRLNHGTAKRRC